MAVVVVVVVVVVMIHEEKKDILVVKEIPIEVKKNASVLGIVRENVTVEIVIIEILLATSVGKENKSIRRLFVFTQIAFSYESNKIRVKQS
jgi:hypothetical protein